MKTPIYLDYQATTPVDPRVLEEMLPYFSERYGNAASRNHPFGWQAEEAVEKARAEIASLIGASAKEIVFTSGSTEAINLALKGAVEMYGDSEGKISGKHIITSFVEHKAILDTCKHLEKIGCDVTYLTPDQTGRVSVEQVEAAMREDTLMVALIWGTTRSARSTRCAKSVPCAMSATSCSLWTALSAPASCRSTWRPTTST